MQNFEENISGGCFCRPVTHKAIGIKCSLYQILSSQTFLKFYKVLYIISRIVWEFFFCSLHFKYLFKVSEIVIFCSKRTVLQAKTPVSKVKSFSNDTFYALNETWEMVFRENCYIWNFSTTGKLQKQSSGRVL